MNYKGKSRRMPNWDYAGKGSYFITFCVHNRECLFGHIKNQTMILNEFGEIAFHEWKKSGILRSELELREFVIMPNHIHGIIIMKPGITKLISNKQQKGLVRKPKSISSFIAGYKSSVTSKINKIIEAKGTSIPIYNNENKLWQNNYHDHVIRNQEEYQKIKYYILNNPKLWLDDKFFLPQT